MTPEKHNIPVGALVEVLPDENDDSSDGIRLYVIRHQYDVGGIDALDALGLKPRIGVAVEDRDVKDGLFSEDALRVVSIE
jgi:hypothetical protein